MGIFIGLLVGAAAGYLNGILVSYGRVPPFYLEKNKTNEAVEWFKKAEEAGCLHAPHAYDYGMLLIEERGDIERGNRYLDKAAEDEYSKSQVSCENGRTDLRLAEQIQYIIRILAGFD